MSINWTIIIVGFLLAQVLSLLFGMVTGILGSLGHIVFSVYTSYFLATLLVGYSVKDNYENGAVHGALVGLVGVIIGLIIGVSFALYPLLHAGSGPLILEITTYNIVTGSIFGLIITMIIGGIGGVAGVFLGGPNKF